MAMSTVSATPTLEDSSLANNFTDLCADMFHNHATDATNVDDRKEQMWRSSLRDWLAFAEIGDRREQIHEAHPKTFRWILEDGKDLGFLEWLQCGSGIFWVRGKSASGKSTLMKFIADERIKSLPPQLDNLFSHILMQRIPRDDRAEAFRYLFTALAWQTSAAGLPLPIAVFATAQQAMSYRHALGLAYNGGALSDVSRWQVRI